MAFMLSPSVERSKVVQWSVPVEYGYNNIAVRTVDVQPDLWTAFFSPFHWSVSRICCAFLYFFQRSASTVTEMEFIYYCLKMSKCLALSV